MIYQFNDFQLDPSNFSLQKIGKSIELEPQVFNLIIYLIENRERLVTRDEIFEKLWNGKEVLDATLSNHIKIARSILGDDGKSQNIIKTVRGRGYQFVAKVKKINNAKSDAREGFRYWRTLPFYLFILLLITIGFTWYFNLDNKISPQLRQSVVNIANYQEITYTTWKAQAQRRDELISKISKRLGVSSDRQFELFFSRYYKQLNEDEIFIFNQIRSMTENSLLKYNQLILNELNSNPNIFSEIALTKDLQQHLIFWINKYHHIFVNRIDMCVLYGGEEDGIAYPDYVNTNVNNWLEKNSN